METHLVSLVQALCSGRLALPTYLNQLEARLACREAELQAFLSEEGRFQRLQREAAELETCYPDPNTRPPLYGVVVGVKDIFRVDGFPTHAGSRLPAALFAGAEAACVTRLKKAGVLILGKTVTTEFAYFAPGPTRNPYNPDHTPGGSSSGSAAAVGAKLCPLALGSQTIGSILRPAAFCGTVGFKPSYRRISAEGVLPLSPSADHIGFFTRDVAGAALVAAVLCDDWRDLAPASRPVLGIPEGPYLKRASAEGLNHFRTTCKRLEQTGYSIRLVPAMPDFDAIDERHRTLIAAEAALIHRDWYARFGHLYHPKTIALIETGRKVSAEHLADCRAGGQALRDQLEVLAEDYGIDAWIAPPARGAAPAGLDSTGDPVMNLPWTHAGLPAISLPAGFSQDGLPLGLQLVAGWWEDEKLLHWAGQIEQDLSENQGDMSQA